MNMPAPNSTFDAILTQHHDGDTSHFDIILERNIEVHLVSRCRYAGINAPELKNKDGTLNPPGEIALLFVQGWYKIATGGLTKHPLIVQIQGKDTYGRPLVTIWRASDGSCLNDALVSSGNAVIVRSISELTW